MQQLAGLILGFALLPVLLLKKVRISRALFVSATLMGIASGFTFSQLGICLADVFTQFASLNSIITVAGVGVVGILFRAYGLLGLIIENISKLVRHVKVCAMLLPAFMGLLPIPGGAMLSAPLSDAIGERLELTAPRRVSVNLSFRHTVFLVIPYCSTIVLVNSVSPPFSMGLFLSLGFCFMCVVFASGYFLFLRNAPDIVNDIDKNERLPALRGLLTGLMPVLLILFFNNVIGLVSSLSVLLAIAATACIHRQKGFLKHVYKKFDFETVLLMCGIFYIQNVIKNMTRLTQFFVEMLLQSGGVAVFFMICGICFFMGFATGINLVPMSIMLPIVFMLPASTSNILALSFIVLLWSFFGYYMSPLHLCHLLSMRSIPCSRLKSTVDNLKHTSVLMAASLAFYFGIISLLPRI
jgi:hypothetical protein